jgi:hypothetical protein
MLHYRQCRPGSEQRCTVTGDMLGGGGGRPPCLDLVRAGSSRTRINNQGHLWVLQSSSQGGHSGGPWCFEQLNQLAGNLGLVLAQADHSNKLDSYAIDYRRSLFCL